jgi:uncharacterized OB-fold protein
MKPGLPLTRCQNCGAGYYPPRLICAKCGAADWRADEVREGVVEQSTVVRVAAGRPDWQPRHIASVRTTDGQLIVAGLEEPLPDATRVALFDRDGAPSARWRDG